MIAIARVAADQSSATGKAFPQYERDEEDFESPSAYFKSTGKPTAKKRMILEDVADMFSEGEDMQLSV